MDTYWREEAKSQNRRKVKIGSIREFKIGNACHSIERTNRDAETFNLEQGDLLGLKPKPLKLGSSPSFNKKKTRDAGDNTENADENK